MIDIELQMITQVSFKHNIENKNVKIKNIEYHLSEFLKYRI